MFDFLSQLFFKQRFYMVALGLILLFILAYSLPILMLPAQVLLVCFLGLCIYDAYLLYSNKTGIAASRICADRFSNGDENSIALNIENNYPFKTELEIIDEIPHQFQVRDILWEETMEGQERRILTYKLRPVKRGEYSFGAINVYASSQLGFINRRFRFAQDQIIAVYPSYMQMKRYELVAFSQRLSELGIKKVRKIGQSMEFEQIKEYVIGDDPRNINWKATARRNELMVNQFEDEKSQRIYSIIDKGRLMKMPFDGLSLLDYSINSSLVISNIAIKKQDKAGLLTFSNKLSAFLPAEKRASQMRKIQHQLFNQKTRYLESNYSLLTAFIHRKITQRSLLLLYTNFESFVTFERQLPYFKALARRHLLVVVFFRNTGLTKLIDTAPKNLEEIYEQSIAENFVYEKERIVRELRRNGILSILTTPKELTVNTINKYLEIKARGML